VLLAIASSYDGNSTIVTYPLGFSRSFVRCIWLIRVGHPGVLELSVERHDLVRTFGLVLDDPG